MVYVLRGHSVTMIRTVLGIAIVQMVLVKVVLMG